MSTLTTKESSIINSDFASRWLFRWVFTFADKSDRRGLWNSPSNKPEDMASFVNKRDMTFAYIEGKNFATKELRIFAEMACCDFINFQTLRLVKSNSNGMIQRDYGMRIIGRNEIITAYETGLVEREQRNHTDSDGYPEWTRF